MKNKETGDPQKITSYFLNQKTRLLIITITGLIYNIGLLAGPYYEGQLAQTLLEILNGSRTWAAMVSLAITYLLVTSAVQISRFFKRLYVRKFANSINRQMKHILYANLLKTPKAKAGQEDSGGMITRAVSDVDACAEGMRKFTTEVFDTGVALISYVVMLAVYRWQLALLCLITPPVSYFLAQKMKTVVQKWNSTARRSADQLSAATMDRSVNALTYRLSGQENNMARRYESSLQAYEAANTKADVLVNALPPLYQCITTVSVLFILFDGAKLIHTGIWDIAAFTTFLSCYTKMAVKSSHAAALFNSVQKAQVSWHRIKPLLKKADTEPAETAACQPVVMDSLSFAYPGAPILLDDVNLQAKPGEMIGITGQIASGKSTFGRLFLNEYPYQGSLKYGSQELRDMPLEQLHSISGYLGHDPELFSASIADNIQMGSTDIDVMKYLRLVCLDQEVLAMPDGIDTLIGSSGTRLSGGQAQRLGLARTLAHPRPLLILDDPFSALDRKTEQEIFTNLQTFRFQRIIFLISHRLYVFPKLDQVIWLADGHVQASTHEDLMQQNPEYRHLYEAQTGGTEHEEK
ncbi:MAG: ABC transporter ATP-binding protein [Lactimicrobium sp.]|jgi:ATP-binding cassette subfamily B multidrug efflux pump|uniref:ABC transporter ATP-binding protein n=1 Tax=Lactimicrobium sp. TaxID=2563780 RepID=UPI002F35F43B